LLDNLATLHCHGVPVDWTVLQPDGRLVDLPARQWQHRRYWVEGDASAVGLQQHDVESHTLLGPHTAVQGTSPSMLWRTYLDFANRPYPGLHAVLGAEVIPAAVVLTTFLAGAEDASLRDVSLRVPIGVTTARELQVVRQDGVLHLSSRLTTQQDDQAWLTHAAAEIAGKRFDPYRVTLAALHEEYPQLLPPECVTDLLTAIGVVGIGFPWRVEEARRCPDGFLARVSSDPDATMGRNTWASLLDAALSVAPMVFPGDPLLRMPGRLREAAVDGPAPGTALIAVRLIEGSGESVEVDIEILTPDGTSVGRLTGVRFGAVERELVVDLGPDDDTTTDEPAWQSLTGAELRDHLVTAVRDIAAGEIRIVADELDPRRPLAELGVDSLMTVAIRLRLERRFATAVPSTLLWNRPTVAAIAEYLFEQLDTATPAPAQPPAPPAPAPVMG
jgi:6-methylsalicylic acid synthase